MLFAGRIAFVCGEWHLPANAGIEPAVRVDPTTPPAANSAATTPTGWIFWPMNDTCANLRTAIRFASARGLEEEPGPPLGLVDPSFQQARAGHVIVLIAQSMRLPHMSRELFVVVA